jgi:hypothetical protein
MHFRRPRAILAPSPFVLKMSSVVSHVVEVVQFQVGVSCDYRVE